MSNVPAAFRRAAATVAVTTTLLATCLVASMPANADTLPAPTPSVTDSTAPAASSNAVAPAGFAVTAGNASLVTKWTASTDTTVTGYNIQYSTDVNFTDGTVTTVPVSGRTVATKTLTGLNVATTYYLRIASQTATSTSDYTAPVTASTFSTPGAPTVTKVTSGNKQFNVAWTAPAATGGSAIVGYQVDYSTDATFATGVTSVNVGVVSNYTVTGLADNTTYYTRLQAKNVVGYGPESAAGSTNTWTIPTTPAAPTLTRGLGQIVAKWTAPATGGSTITGYTVQYATDADFTQNVGTMSVATTTATITGLPANTTYFVRVLATNAIGSSTYGAASNAATFAAPTAPGVPTLTRGNKQLTATWTAPANGGSTITSYTVQYATDADFTQNVGTVTSTTTTATITGLPVNTTYYVRVLATNAVGSSAYGAIGNAATFSAPAAPATPTLTRGNKQLTVTWVAPANGGSAVTGYTVQYATDADFTQNVQTVAATASPKIITGLNANTTYYVRVLATNIVGSSPYSATANSATFAVPGTVTNVKETAGNGQITATWTAPTVTGGSNVTGYRVQYSTDSTFASGVTTVDTGSTTASYIIKNLTPGTTLYVQVAAINVVGAGNYTAAASSATTFTVPGAPTSVTAGHGAGSITVKWVAPVNKGGTVLGNYTVQLASDANFTNIVQTLNPVSTAVTTTFTGLPTGTTYYARVIATNVVGASVPSAVVSQATSALPGAPTSITATTVVTGGGALKLAWKASTALDGALVTGYAIQYSTDSTFATGVTSVTSTGTGLTYTITGLPLSTAYYVRIATISGAGQGAYSAGVAGVTATAPGVPQNIVAAPASVSSLNVTWNTPANQGSAAVTGYTVQYSTDATFATDTNTVTVTGRTATLTDLTVGTSYYVRVLATSTVASGNYSSASVGVPGAAPDAPTDVAAEGVPSETSATVTWTAPANTNGYAITGYKVQYATDTNFTTGVTTITLNSTNTATTLTNLSPDTVYYVRVAATNGVGTGDWSAASTIHATHPDTPAAPSVNQTGDQSTLNVSWIEPEDGGMPITAYLVAYSTNSDMSGAATFNTGNNNTSATLTGLNAGTTYYTTVTAINAIGNSDTSLPGSATTNIYAPSGVNVWNDGWGGVYWSSNGCAAGGTLQYDVVQTVRDNNGGWWDITGWTTFGGPVGIPYSQGYPQAANVYAHCVGPNATSDNSGNGSSWVANLNGPSDAPTLTQGTYGGTQNMAWTAVGCPAGSTTNYRLYTTRQGYPQSGSGNNVDSGWMAWATSWTRPSLDYGSSIWWHNGASCSTPWRWSSEAWRDTYWA